MEGEGVEGAKGVNGVEGVIGARSVEDAVVKVEAA